MAHQRSEAEIRALLGPLLEDGEIPEDWPVERIKLSDYHPADYNPRTISDDGVKRLAKSMRGNGQLDTITVNRRTGNIVSGHQRASVMLAVGIEEAWARIVDMTEPQERAANIAANNRQAQGEFEMEELSTLLAGLQAIDDPDFDIEDTAFEIGEVREMVDRPVPPDDEDKTADDGTVKTVICPSCKYEFDPNNEQ